ncbi:hypothetical protein [Pseudaquabacterium pictum]|uniref:hypothetical protein n=1 Tax=Pseudaquabacterium pictum TaxID=2315236 RepID=UPI0010F4DA2F|nr:hypothetical protein [Rubrivivax pictus]
MTSARPVPRTASFLFAPLLLAGLLAAGQAWAQATAPAPAAAASGPTLRAELAKPLTAAQEAVRSGKSAEALARIAEAEAMPALTPYEQYVVMRLKAPALFGSGDQAGALALFEKVVASPLLPTAEKLPLTETTIKLALQLKQYATAQALMKSYLDSRGPNAEIASLYPQVLSVQNDHAGVIAHLLPVVAADEAAKRPTPEATLRLLASSQNQVKDSVGYLATLTRLAGSTGKTDYWDELINRTVRKDGFADDRLRLDVYRLRLVVGIALEGDEIGDMAFRANQAGLPAEAQALLDDGYKAGLLGKGPNAAADQKLRESATKAAAQDRATLAETEAAALKAPNGNALYGLGMAVSSTGAHERGLALITQGIAKGGLRRPDDAQLHQGIVALRAGKADQAKAAFAAVKGSDGAADLARLFTVYIDSPARK